MSYSYYNPNPAGRKSVGDCTIRALSKALNQTWEATYAGLALEGFLQGDLPNADAVWGNYLRRRGFRRHLIPDDGLGAYTVEDFAQDNPSGIFILSMPGRHVLTIQYLLPVYLTNMKKPDLAMTLSVMDGYYLGHTCLTSGGRLTVP